MHADWNKVKLPTTELGDLGKELSSYLDNMRSELESESKKVQHLLDLVLLELQNQSNQDK